MLLAASVRVEGTEIAPRYLTKRDHAWLEALIDEYACALRRPRREVAARLRRSLAVPSPRVKQRVAAHVLLRWATHSISSPVKPALARFELFLAGAPRLTPRDEVVSNTAELLGVPASLLEDSLFADLPGERLLTALPDGLSPERLALESNLVIVGALVRRASRVVIRAWGQTRDLVRHARKRGLICSVSELHRSGREGVRLDVSGPFAVFRHTEVYGRALASLVPRLAWSDDFELVAECALSPGQEPYVLRVRSGDPVGLGRELEALDDALERRFARDFSRASNEFELLRDPDPSEASGELVFPDFALVRRAAPNERWLLEIVGFWTSESIAERLERLSAAGQARYVLCVDEGKCCGGSELPSHPRVVRYRKRLDPAAVLAACLG